MSDPLTVLVVEDEALMHPMIEDMLEEGGFKAQIAASAAQAIGMLEAAGAAFSALVTDINLGTPLTGWDIAKRGREIDPHLPVVYMTGFADNEWASQGVPNSLLLSKPFAAAQLLTAVAQLVTGAGPRT